MLHCCSLWYRGICHYSITRISGKQWHQLCFLWDLFSIRIILNRDKHLHLPRNGNTQLLFTLVVQVHFFNYGGHDIWNTKWFWVSISTKSCLWGLIKFVDFEYHNADITLWHDIYHIGFLADFVMYLYFWNRWNKFMHFLSIVLRQRLRQRPWPLRWRPWMHFLKPYVHLF